MDCISNYLSVSLEYWLLDIVIGTATVLFLVKCLAIESARKKAKPGTNRLIVRLYSLQSSLSLSIYWAREKYNLVFPNISKKIPVRMFKIEASKVPMIEEIRSSKLIQF